MEHPHQAQEDQELSPRALSIHPLQGSISFPCTQPPWSTDPRGTSGLGSTRIQLNLPPDPPTGLPVLGPPFRGSANQGPQAVGVSTGIRTLLSLLPQHSQGQGGAGFSGQGTSSNGAVSTSPWPGEAGLFSRPGTAIPTQHFATKLQLGLWIMQTHKEMAVGQLCWGHPWSHLHRLPPGRPSFSARGWHLIRAPAEKPRLLSPVKGTQDVGHQGVCRARSRIHPQPGAFDQTPGLALCSQHG